MFKCVNMSKFQVLVGNKEDLEKLPLKVKWVAMPFHFSLKKMVLELIPGATLTSKVELLPKMVARMDEQLQRDHEELLQELRIAGLKNSELETLSTFKYLTVLHGFLEGCSKTGELT